MQALTAKSSPAMNNRVKFLIWRYELRDCQNCRVTDERGSLNIVRITESLAAARIRVITSRVVANAPTQLGEEDLQFRGAIRVILFQNSKVLSLFMLPD